MSRTAFLNLKIFKSSEELADEIWKTVSHWKPEAKFTVGRQLIRAADAIGANIAEVGRGTFADNRRFVRIARGSLNETGFWLRRAHKRNLLTAAEVSTLSAMLNALAPRLNAYLNSIGKISGSTALTTDHGRLTKDK